MDDAAVAQTASAIACGVHFHGGPPPPPRALRRSSDVQLPHPRPMAMPRMVRLAASLARQVRPSSRAWSRTRSYNYEAGHK